jgi:hypothetical protein
MDQTPSPDDSFPFIQARWFDHNRMQPIDLIVIHSAEVAPSNRTARNVAEYFKNPLNEKGQPVKASAHFVVGVDIWQCVKVGDVAWHAPGVNGRSIGIEHEGYAKYTKEEWLSVAGKDMLARSAELTGRLCKVFGIPIVLLKADDLKKKAAGITTHVEVTKAFRFGTHWDPGPGFPLEMYIDLVKGVVEGTQEGKSWL